MPTETEEREQLVFEDATFCITDSGIQVTTKDGETETLEFRVDASLIGATSPIPLGTVEYQGKEWFARYYLTTACKGRLELNAR